MRKMLVATAVAVLCCSGAAQADDLGDVELMDLWASQKSICKDGDEESPDTWIACGRSDAFAAVLAARGMCLDSGQGVWRVGTRSKTSSESAWRCSLVTS